MKLPTSLAGSPWPGLALAVGVHVLLGATASAPQVHTGGDNAAYLSLAHSLVQDGSYRELWHPDEPAHSKYPPVYPAFLAAMILAGATTWGAFKTASLALTALATAFCFLWARRLGGDRAGLVVALLFGASYALLFAAQWILSEPLFLVATFGSLWLLAPKPGSERPPPRRDLALGLLLAGVAYFTRSAGAPLVAAAALWLTLGKRWKELAAFAAVLAVPAFLWHGRSAGEYVSEFWLINPYDPDLGRAGIGELAARLATNGWNYVSQFVPEGIAGSLAGAATVVGVVLAAAAVTGWFQRVRSGPGVAEIFAALYVGLMLAWPSQWSGDRFALPILPLVLFYGYELTARLAATATKATTTTQADRAPRSRRTTKNGRAAKTQETARPQSQGTRPPERWRRTAGATVLAALVALTAGLSWTHLRSLYRGCREATAAAGPWGCYGNNVRAFHLMALWARDHLPEGSAAFSRKPRLFYAFSGVPSVTYPFESDDARFLAMADSLGINYFVRSNWDGSESRWVDPVIAAHPERFCLVVGFREPYSVSLLAIRPAGVEGDESAAGRDSGEGVALARCGLEGGSSPPSPASIASMTVPFLADRSLATAPGSMR